MKIKRFLVTMLMVTIASGLVACSNKDNSKVDDTTTIESSVEESTTKEEETTLEDASTTTKVEVSTNEEITTLIVETTFKEESLTNEPTTTTSKIEETTKKKEETTKSTTSKPKETNKKEETTTKPSSKNPYSEVRYAEDGYKELGDLTINNSCERIVEVNVIKTNVGTTGKKRFKVTDGNCKHLEHFASWPFEEVPMWCTVEYEGHEYIVAGSPWVNANDNEKGSPLLGPQMIDGHYDAGENFPLYVEYNETHDFMQYNFDVYYDVITVWLAAEEYKGTYGRVMLERVEPKEQITIEQ